VNKLICTLTAAILFALPATDAVASRGKVTHNLYTAHAAHSSWSLVRIHPAGRNWLGHYGAFVAPRSRRGHYRARVAHNGWSRYRAHAATRNWG
jgi:hypothetical protein